VFVVLVVYRQHLLTSVAQLLTFVLSMLTKLLLEIWMLGLCSFGKSLEFF